MDKKYTTPKIDFIMLDLESPVMSSSPTGETFSSRNNYEGEWE